VNIFELLSFVLAVAISFFVRKLFLHDLGWWGAVPAALVGFGLVACFLFLLRKLPSKRMDGK
jgi:hypothetical protein